jgi:hypothetical protein
MEWIQLGIQRCDPSPKNDPTRTRHLKYVPVPNRLRHMGRHRAVGVMFVDEVFEVGQEYHSDRFCLEEGLSLVGSSLQDMPWYEAVPGPKATMFHA